MMQYLNLKVCAKSNFNPIIDVDIMPSLTETDYGGEKYVETTEHGIRQSVV